MYIRRRFLDKSIAIIDNNPASINVSGEQIKDKMIFFPLTKSCCAYTIKAAASVHDRLQRRPAIWELCFMKSVTTKRT